MSKKHKVLIVEDEKPMLRALVEKFTHEGFEVISAENGEKGLEIALRDKPEMILLDVIMPKMDGITMLKKLRTDDTGKSIPVILLTNLSDTEKIIEAADSGVFDYLVKTDWKIDDVVAKVKERLAIK